ncbi:MAG TPA: peptide deformylase [Candidatus Acidoferrum sp.]|jgi:peptide deformylase|nr:peptide deformylase [Candidatus Acidoferrum sp.]
MSIRDILLLGHPLLNQRSESVQATELPAAVAVGHDLQDTLNGFRAKHGWGRAIAAPQIGVLKRVVYLQIDKPQLIINPVLAAPSEEMMEFWDDCMSFPDLLVRVKRHAWFTMAYHDENWMEHQRRIDGVLSELMQHEIDHLDGVLAVSRAIDGASFALRSQRNLLAGAVFANNPRTATRPVA